jgi:hypothetical protein
MRVLACYTDMHPAAAEALAAFAPQAELVDVTGDEHAYWREIRSRWTGEQDLIIIEQDIEIAEGVIESMAACDRDWCCYAYRIFRTKVRLRDGLGCTKFSAAIQRKVNARHIAEGFALCKNCKGQGCWYHLDCRISGLLRQEGCKPHVHGDVTHHHAYDEQPEGQEVRGRPIEYYQEDWGDIPPAVIIADHWPRREMYAVNARQAIAIAADLERLQGEYGNEPAKFVMPPAGFSTDKVAQGYLPAYSHLARQLGPAARVCEVGVALGGSLDMWRTLMPQATIAGIDIDPGARWPEGTIKIQASQDDPQIVKLLDEHEESWDLIVDDASHDGKLTRATLDLLWPLVSPGGWYVIEDWFTGFACHPEYDDSMLELAKSLLDRLDPFYSEDDFMDVESIEYRHGMAILRKST